MPGFDLSGFRSSSPEEQEAMVDQIRVNAADLRISVAEHFMGYLDENPQAGNIDTFSYKHSSKDVNWESWKFLAVNDAHVKQKYPRLVESFRVVQRLGYNIAQMTDEGEPIRAADSADTIVRRTVTQLNPATLRYERLGNTFTVEHYNQIQSAVDHREPLPDIRPAGALLLASSMLVDAYMAGHPGWQSTPY